MATLFLFYPYVDGSDLDKKDVEARDDAKEFKAWVENELEWDGDEHLWWGETVTFKLPMAPKEFDQWFSGWACHSSEGQYWKYSTWCHYNFELDLKYDLLDDRFDWFTWTRREWKEGDPENEPPECIERWMKEE